MRIGIVGLGRMGLNMAERMLKQGQEVVAYNRSQDKVRDLATRGAIPAASTAELVAQLPAPRVVWLMLPAGEPTEQHMFNPEYGVVNLLSPNDIIVDGANSLFKDTQRRSPMITERGIRFLDAKVSGGIVAKDFGYPVMMGGDQSAYDDLKPALDALCLPSGAHGLFGPHGAGHFVGMVHNAIEYGMMQAIGEGFELLAEGPYENFDLAKIANLWNHGSIVESFLMRMAEQAFSEDQKLSAIADYVDDTGEGRWAIQTAIENNVPFSVITQSLFTRIGSREESSFQQKVLAALRLKFGGHAVRPAGD
jgi:6-phosphogluconate dehydrogenase